MSQPSPSGAPFEEIGIVGCGLIGCSIAAALKQRGFSGRIYGCGRPGPNLETAVSRGYVDAAVCDSRQLAPLCDLIVIATPVNRIVAEVLAIGPQCRPGTVITDAGSVKQPICEPLATGLGTGVTFIGSHPIAGSEKQGCSHASPDLFAGRVCVITPPPAETSTVGPPRELIDRLSGFWRFLGMTVVEMSPEAHDRALAQTSHVPHVVAAALASTLATENRDLTAGGFQDTTRIAAGDPELWSAILLANAGETCSGIRVVSEQLEAFRRALEAGDEESLLDLLRVAKTNRDGLHKKN